MKMFLAAFAAAVSLVAQGASSSITGTVLDPQEQPVSGANVKITAKSNGFAAVALTQDSGVFRLNALPTGVYSLSIEKQGFKAYKLDDFQLVAGQDITKTVRLEIGAIQDGVTVTAEIAEIQRVASNGVRGSAYSPYEVENIPMFAGGQGRSFRALSYQTSGVGFARVAHAPFTVNGNRPLSAVNTMVDSAEYNDPVSGNLLGRGITEQPVSMETVEAVEMQTSNFKAEYGRASGAVINLVTKQGTNDWRGSLYYLFQNERLNARNTFLTQKAPLRVNQPGFTIGGPLKRNKLFFYGGYEVNVRNAYRASSTIVTLTAAERARAAASVRPLLQYYPEPNIPGTNLNSASVASPSTIPTGLGRMDYQINAKHRAGARVNWVNAVTPTIARLLAGFADTENRSWSGVTNLDSSLTSRVFNQFRVTYSTYWARVSPMFPSLGDPAINGQVGTVLVTGLPALGTFIPFTETRSHNYTFSDDITMQSGRHILKAGLIGRTIHNNSTSERNFNGTLVFPAIPLFLAGTPVAYSRAIGNSRIDQRNREYGFYAQDDWKFTPSLTVNLGMRYEYYGVPGEKYNRLTQRYAGDGNNFAPRIGFAWDLGGRNSTIVRGGYGMFYSPLAMDFIAQSRFGPPIVTTFTRPQPRFPDLLAGAFVGSDAYLVDTQLRNPYVQNWNMTLERQLWNRGTVLSGAYVGNRGINLPRTSRPNGGENLAANLRPNPTRGVVSYLTAGSMSTYHSLQANFRTAIGRRMSIRGTYTYSTAIDTASDSNFLPVDESNWRNDRARSDFDQPHLFTGFATYDLPFFARNRWLGGWQAVGTLFARSGTPFSLLANTNNSTGTIVNRINNVAGSIDRTRNGSQWFTLAQGFTPASVLPSAGSTGTLGRNTEREQRFADLALSLHKNFAITERIGLQLRAEAFNALNRVNYNAPTATLANPALFGRILTADDPRQMQLMLKLRF